MKNSLRDLVGSFQKGKEIGKVAQTHAVPAPVKIATPPKKRVAAPKKFKLPLQRDESLDLVGRAGSVLVFVAGGGRVEGDTLFLDLRGSKPRTARIRGLFPYYADYDPERGWLLSGRQGSDIETCVRGAWIVRDPFGGPGKVERLPAFDDKRNRGANWAVWIDGTPVVWPDSQDEAYKLPKTAWRPMILQGSRYRELRELPGVPSSVSPDVHLQKARLGDGRDVLIWQGQGYELEKGRFRPTFVVKKEDFTGECDTVPCGTDGFYYLDNRSLFEVHRNGKRIAHLPKISTMMTITPGPNGTLVMRHGDNKARNHGCVYHPASGSVVQINRKDFPELRGVDCWPAAEALLGIGYWGEFFTRPFPDFPSAPGAAPAAAPAGPRRFEFVKGGSSKFWEVSVKGSDLTVRFGRIGTDGQTKTKSFKSEGLAKTEADKLVREKTAKGYRGPKT